MCPFISPLSFSPPFHSSFASLCTISFFLFILPSPSPISHLLLYFPLLHPSFFSLYNPFCFFMPTFASSLYLSSLPFLRLSLLFYLSSLSSHFPFHHLFLSHLLLLCPSTSSLSLSLLSSFPLLSSCILLYLLPKASFFSVLHLLPFLFLLFILSTPSHLLFFLSSPSSLFSVFTSLLSFSFFSSDLAFFLQLFSFPPSRHFFSFHSSFKPSLPPFFLLLF